MRLCAPPGLRFRGCSEAGLTGRSASASMPPSAFGDDHDASARSVAIDAAQNGSNRSLAFEAGSWRVRAQ